MTRIKYIISGMILCVSMLATPLFVGQVQAQESNYEQDQLNVSGRYNVQDRYRDRDDWRQRWRYRTPFWRYYQPFPDQRYAPRIIIIINREYPTRYFVITNRFARDNNRVVLRVSNYDYIRLNYAYRINNNIDIDINTGRNVVSFNTGIGVIQTGDVNIDIN